jgi:hypothetical protein
VLRRGDGPRFSASVRRQGSDFTRMSVCVPKEKAASCFVCLVFLAAAD